METKDQVVKMLDFLDAKEVQQVLAYVRNFYPPMRSDAHERKLKAEAMLEIKKALRNPVEYAA